ncbi:MAG: MFS transporter [Pseudobdellovibrio sp.]
MTQNQNTFFADFKTVLTANVIVAALGYFVDIYDLLLFGIVRVSSLKGIGIADSELLEKGVLLINSQMIGMLVGGVAWGILGDKKGRLSVLFGSILLYSIANIANAFATSIEVYAALRFVAGLGLAGELGAAITLVSETLPQHKRGFGTTIVASFGILGAVAAALVGDLFSWNVSYLIGGAMGLGLLILRFRMHESGLFNEASANVRIKKGQFLQLFKKPDLFFKYVRCILIGVPVWYVVGILITFSPELAKALNVNEAISAGRAIMFCYAGLAVGDLVSGLISQYLKSRVRSIWIFMSLTLLMTLVYFNIHQISAAVFYLICAGLGFGAGYWAVFATTAAEQFGTNLRATVTTSVPNFVRGSVVLLTLLFQYFKGLFNSDLVISASLVGALVFAVAFFSLYRMQDSFKQDLNFHED